MNRFKKSYRKPLLPRFLAAAAFCVIIGLFMSGVSSVSRIAGRNEEQSLQNAIVRSAVHCYATEGFYPDTMEYLEEHYGITYDKTRFLVSYETVGSNMMPDISVLPLRAAKGGGL